MTTRELSALACFAAGGAIFGWLMCGVSRWYAVPYAFCTFMVILVVQQAYEKGRKE